MTAAKSRFYFLVLLAVALITIFPVFLIINNAFRSHEAFVRSPFGMDVFRAGNFVEVWRIIDYGRGFLNSLLLMGCAVAVVLFTVIPASYVIARRKTRFWRGATLYFLFSITVPIQLFLFPLYFSFAKLNWLNSIPATAVIVAAVGLPLPLFLLTAYIDMIPQELEQAAEMDGASPMNVLCRIIIPLMQAGIITAALLSSIAIWNEYLITSTFLQEEKVRTAGLRFLSLVSSRGNDYALLSAAALLLILPVLLVYLFLQKYIITGIAAGALKE